LTLRFKSNVKFNENFCIVIYYCGLINTQKFKFKKIEKITVTENLKIAALKKSNKFKIQVLKNFNSKKNSHQILIFFLQNPYTSQEHIPQFAEHVALFVKALSREWSSLLESLSQTVFLVFPISDNQNYLKSTKTHCNANS